MTHTRRSTDNWRLKPVKRAFIVITIVFVVVLIIFAKILRDVQHNSNRINGLVAQNTERIFDIQRSRLESCKRTYGGIREVFKPFVPPIKKRTKAQQDNLDKFNRNVDRLQKQCIQQITPPKVKEGES